MRSFPRPNRRRSAAAVASASLLTLASLPLAHAGLATADDSLKEKQKKVERHLGSAHEDFHESSKRLTRATAAFLRAQERLASARAHLASTRAELAAARALDRQMQARLAAAVVRLQNARRALEEGRRKVREQERVLSAVAVDTYEAGSPQLMSLSMVLNSQDPSELTSRLTSVQAVMDKQQAVLAELEAAKVLLFAHAEEIEAAKVEVARQRAAAAENLARKQALEAQAREATGEVRRLVSDRSRVRAAAVRAKNADLRMLRRLEAERDRIKRLLAAEAARLAAQQAAREEGDGGRSGGGGAGGPLSYPVDGYVTSPFGWRIHPIWGYRALHDGVDFGAACGTPIRAAAAGRVVSAYYQGAWGNRVILAHGVQRGVGVATISNHLSSFAVSAGEDVQRGEVIGYVGSTGWSTGCHLHFTVLENGNPVDPMRWL